MKTSVLFLLFLLFFSIPTLAASPYYEWIGKNSSQLKTALGEPGQITCNDQTHGDTMYIYKTEIGYMAYVFHDLKINHANMSTYWKTKKQANSALKLVLDMYKKDGLKIEKKSDKITTCSDTKYSITVEMTFLDGWYGISESAKEIIKGD
jgi:hypothetical protein